LENPNRIQREFDSNVAIATFDHEPSAPKNKPFQTKACFAPFPCEAATCCHFAPSRRGRLGMGDAVTSRL
jgi:hypothetical protein